MSLPEVLGLVYALVTALVVALPGRVGAGRALGQVRHGRRLPRSHAPPLRIAALVQGLVLAALALIVLAAAGLVDVALLDDWPG